MALMLAALNGNVDTVRLLLDCGADIEAKNDARALPLPRRRPSQWPREPRRN